MLKKFVKLVGGDPNQREIDKLSVVVDQINDLENEYEKLSRGALAAKTQEFRDRLAKGETLDDLLVEAFAVVREASKRTIGLRHYDVQLIGGTILHQGKIVEMKTGEGKTLVATLPLYLNALTGKGAHLITVNDYLARRDARWMAPIYDLLGLSVGVLQMAARTENGKKAFLVDLERESPHEDQHQLVMVPRKEAYLADITYGTNSEFGFDYLRDNMTMRWSNRVQRGHHYAIIDEVDNVLIDEARTPLIISGPAQDQAEWYERMAQVVKSLRPEDYEVSEKNNTVTLTEIGEARVEQMLGMALGDPDRPEDITPEQARTLGYLEQALRAQHLFHRNKEYIVQAGKVVIVDEFTGRLMPGRRWSDGLHQAVEAKEGVKVQSESVTYATITIQNYFRMYEKLAGMTGTAVTEAEEFSEIYKLDVLALPTNLEYVASRQDTDLDSEEERDQSGYKYTYYYKISDNNKQPVFWKRKDYPDVVYRTEEAKIRSIVQEILRYHVLGRPMLVGTTSVELSEHLSRRLKAEQVRRLAQIILLRDRWLERNDRVEDGRVIDELAFLTKKLEDLNTSELRKMARDLDMSFNPEEEQNVNRLLSILNINGQSTDRLVATLQAGIPHQVLNARKHTEESQIIAGAGAFGAVTIATNMAGRGVDIRLGGELAEEIIASVNRVLKRTNEDDPYEMSLEEKYQALTKLDPSDYGIYESEINYFLKHIHEMETVREVGGLHVIGSERHDARRIDNQLRGRAARQGDPGSSRFYLSMEDELMRLFGGGQADALMQRMKIDDAVPLEAGLVNRIVEQAQTRVEGANFDVRKHLLEYDDVLNTQRKKIYEQRDRIFKKEDLSEDVSEMLETELARRVSEALGDESEPWKLLAWLDQIQPPIISAESIFPSYTLKIIGEKVERVNAFPLNQEQALGELLLIARSAIEAEEAYLIRTTENILDQTRLQLDQSLVERMDSLETFLEGLYLEEETESLNSRDLLGDLSSLLQIPIKLSNQQQRELLEDPDLVVEDIRSQIENELVNRSITRVVGAVERRLEESIEINAQDIATNNWGELANRIIAAIRENFANRVQRYLGDGTEDQILSSAQIPRDLQKALEKFDGPIDANQFYQLLLLMPQGTKAEFDKKTHRRVFTRTSRLSYVYYAAGFLPERETPDIMADYVLDHLRGAQAALRRAWGLSEMAQIPSATLGELNQKVQANIQDALNGRNFEELAPEPLSNLPADIKDIVIAEMGRQALTSIYRQLLLNVITELWVDYLTQMEGLRVSIGLEAYAQRDPLVQYKNKAFELYQELLSNVRLSVLSRMFKYRPQTTPASIATPATRISQIEAPAVVDSSQENLPKQAREPAAVQQATKQERKKRQKMSTSQKRRRSRKR